MTSGEDDVISASFHALFAESDSPPARLARETRHTSAPATSRHTTPAASSPSPDETPGGASRPALEARTPWAVRDINQAGSGKGAGGSGGGSGGGVDLAGRSPNDIDLAVSVGRVFAGEAGSSKLNEEVNLAASAGWLFAGEAGSETGAQQAGVCRTASFIGAEAPAKTVSSRAPETSHSTSWLWSTIAPYSASLQRMAGLVMSSSPVASSSSGTSRSDDEDITGRCLRSNGDKQRLGAGWRSYPGDIPCRRDVTGMGEWGVREKRRTMCYA